MTCIREGCCIEEAGLRWRPTPNAPQIAGRDARLFSAGRRRWSGRSRSPSVSPSTSRSFAMNIRRARSTGKDGHGSSYRSGVGGAACAIRKARRKRSPTSCERKLDLIEELDYPNYSSPCTTSSDGPGTREFLPGPRLGGQFGGLFLPGDHRGRSHAAQARRALRPLHLQGARRAPRHRRRFRARAARARHAVRLPTLRQERAAICATVIHYRPRSAIRDVGKALGSPRTSPPPSPARLGTGATAFPTSTSPRRAWIPRARRSPGDDSRRRAPGLSPPSLPARGVSSSPSGGWTRPARSATPP